MKAKKHSKKWSLLSKPTRYFIITGSRASGKSYEESKFQTFLTYEKNTRILFTRKTLTSAHLSIIPEFQEKIELFKREQDFDINQANIINKTTNSEVLFRGLQSSSRDNTANLKSLQGITDWVLDEAEELTDEKVFDTIDLSIRDKIKQNRVTLIMNPSTREHWVYKKFFENAGVNYDFCGVKGNTTYIHTTYLDNIQNLSESFLQRVEEMKQGNFAKYEHLMLGKWLKKAEGVIFENWKLGKFEEVDNITYGQDYGFSVDPTTLIKVGIDKARKKIFLKEIYFKQGLSTDEIYNLNRLNVEQGLIIADSAEPRLISELKNKGLNIKGAVKGQGSVTGGISLMQGYEMIVDPLSTNLIKELNNYAWSDKKSGTPIDLWNHGIDAARYSISYAHQNNFKFSIG
jgi:phage terminase large subunit